MSVVSETRTAWGSALNGGASIVSAGLTFVLAIVVTQGFGAEDTGVFFGVIALFAIVGTAAKLGTETALVFQIARFRSAGANRSIRHALAAAIGPVLLFSGFAAIVLIGFSATFGRLFNSDRADAFADGLQAIAPLLPAWSLGLVLLGATRGAGTMIPTMVGLQVLQPAAQLALVLLGAQQGWSLSTVLFCWGLPLIGTALIAGIGILPHLRTPTSNNESELDRQQVRKELWAFAAPRGLAGTLQVSLDRVGILLIGALATSVAAGQWAAISRLVGVAQRVFHAIGQALNPRVSALAEHQDWPAVTRVFRQITILTVVALSPALLGLMVFPKAVLGIFGGEEFSEASVPLMVAALFTLIAVVFAHVDNVLLMTGRSRTALANTAAALAVTIVLNLLLLSPFGLTGAAIATAAGVLVYRASSAVQINRWFGIEVLSRPVVAAFGLAIAVAGSIMVIGRLIGGDQLVAALISGGIAAVMYAAVVITKGAGLGIRLGLDVD